jgi:hypothetical protein
MIHAKLGDTVLTFPDGTPDDVVDKAVAEHVATTQRDTAAHKANSGFLGGLDSTVRSLAQGATFGFGDEISALGDATIGHYFGRGSQAPDVDTRYAENLPNERARDKAFHEDHPVLATTGQIAGGIGGAVAGATLAPAAAVVAAPAAELGATIGAGVNAVGRAGAAIPYVGPAARSVAQGVNALWHAAPAGVQTVGRLAAGGAVAGGVGGFGEGEGGFDSRMGDAAKGAGWGAALAPGLGAVGRVLAPWGNRLLTLMGRNAGPDAERQILRSFERSGRSVDDVAAASTAAGDAPVTVMDLSGRPTVQLGATAANTPSTATQAAENMVVARRGDRPERVAAASDAALGGGSGTDVATATAERQLQRQTEASPLYERAFSQPAGMTENMGHILNDPIGQQGLRRGLEIQRIEGNTRRARGEEAVPTHDPSIQFNEQGDPVIVGVPNMRSLDAVKRGMDAILEDARDPTSGRINMTERLRAIDQMRHQWVTMLDEGNPHYAEARRAWAGPSAQMEATAAGRSVLGADRDVVARRMDDMAPDEQDAYRLGVGRAITDLLSDPGTAIGKARKLVDDRNMQTRLRSVLGDERLEQLNAVLRREVEMGQVEHTVNPRAGSHTARLTAGGADMADNAGPLSQAIALALQGRFKDATHTFAGDLYRTSVNRVNPRIANELGQRLFTTDPIQRQAMIEQLRRRQANDLASVYRAQRWAEPALRGAARGVGGIAGRP